MASSKTLTPTNVTISIPAMTDVPDASVFSNCVDKEADAVNAINAKTVLSDSDAFSFSNASDVAISAAVCNRVVYLRFRATFASLTNGGVITTGTIAERLRPHTQVIAQAFNFSNGQPLPGTFWIDGQQIRYWGAAQTNVSVIVTVTYINSANI